MNRLKPFFDAYTGPFRSRGRFWTGLLLLTRGVLHAVTALNVSGDPRIILGAVTTTVSLLLLVAGLLPHGLYRRRSLTALEYSSLINLGILASFLFIFEDSIIVSHLSVSAKLLLFIGVIIRHFISTKPIHNSRFCRRVRRFLPGNCCNRLLGNEIINREEYDEADAIPHVPYALGDREPLLADYNEERNFTVTY